jgi:HIRAN domain
VDRLERGAVRVERRPEVQDPFIQVTVEFSERYWYPDDGGQVWLSGYQLVDPQTGSFLARDAPQLAERGLHVSGVAGARHHAEALAGAALAPGDRLELRREPDNPHDANAIAVHGGGAHLGFVPRELAAELAPELDAGRPWSAIVLREQRDSPRDPRSGVTMLLAPADGIELQRRE